MEDQYDKNEFRSRASTLKTEASLSKKECRESKTFRDVHFIAVIRLGVFPVFVWNVKIIAIKAPFFNYQHNDNGSAIR